MAYTTFESDLLDAAQPFAYIPTGAILTLAAPYTTLSDADLASLGLLKCDSVSKNTYDYVDLHKVISNKYGGAPYTLGVTDNSSSYTGYVSYAGVWATDGFSYRIDLYSLSGTPFALGALSVINTSGGSVFDIDQNYVYVYRYLNDGFVSAILLGLNKIFYLPSLHTSKTTIKGSSTANNVGSNSGTNIHQHSIGTITWNSDDNATSMAHTHNAYAGDRVFLDGNPARHEHAGTLASYNGVPNTDASTATNGNTNNNGTRQHNHNLNYNAYNSSLSLPDAHTHNVLSQALSNNTQLNSTGNAFSSLHKHTTTLATTTTNQVTSADPHTNQYTVPYSPMLYFIKA
jgi:hypothetical protein